MPKRIQRFQGGTDPRFERLVAYCLLEVVREEGGVEVKPKCSSCELVLYIKISNQFNCRKTSEMPLKYREESQFLDVLGQKLICSQFTFLVKF